MRVPRSSSGMGCSARNCMGTFRHWNWRGGADLGRNYERALLAVERNNHGYGVLAHLNTLEYENLFEKDGQLGWLTSAASRPAMIENMAAMLVAEPALFHSRRLLEECRTFVRRGRKCGGGRRRA